jgi:hypothetical protein
MDNQEEQLVQALAGRDGPRLSKFLKLILKICIRNIKLHRRCLFLNFFF